MFKTFLEMPVWHRSNALAIEIFALSSNLPRSEDYGLTSQIRRASNGISGNIAEACLPVYQPEDGRQGFGRKTSKDKTHFYIMARGSAFETQSHLFYGSKIGNFDNDTTEKLIQEYATLIHDLNKLMASLK